MNYVDIRIKFPDRFTYEEVLKQVAGELDLKTWKAIGVTFYKID